MFVIYAKYQGEWVEVCRTAHLGWAQHEYEQIVQQRGSDNVRLVRETAS